MWKHVLQLHAIHDGKHAFEKLFRYLEADEVVILLWRVTLLGHLRHVEAEFRANVRRLVLRIKNEGAKLGAKLGIGEGDRLVHRGMSGNVRRVVRQRSQSKGVLVRGLAFLHQFEHKVAAAHIVHQVAELLIAEGVVAHVLDHGAAIGISVSLAHLVVRQPRITRQDHRAEADPSRAGR